MTDIGYHASHEQFSPKILLDWITLAELHGFSGVSASDHFHSWSKRQGEAGFVWSWLGSALERTSLAYGTINAPGYRYHPAIVAQAAATLAKMYPKRFWLSVGSGELLNEHITGEHWPVKDERNARLKECVDILRKLWDGETVTHHGRVTVEEATLYTHPETKPPIIGAALSEETARWLGEWADGMITIGTSNHKSLEKRVRAFREQAPDKPIYLKGQLSYDRHENVALDGAYDQWRTNSVPGPITENLRTTEQYDAVGNLISKDQLKKNVRVSADIDKHISWLREDLSLGFEKIFLHNVNREQEQFIERFGNDVLPEIQ